MRTCLKATIVRKPPYWIRSLDIFKHVRNSTWLFLRVVLHAKILEATFLCLQILGPNVTYKLTFSWWLEQVGISKWISLVIFLLLLRLHELRRQCQLRWRWGWRLRTPWREVEGVNVDVARAKIAKGITAWHPRQPLLLLNKKGLLLHHGHRHWRWRSVIVRGSEDVFEWVDSTWWHWAAASLRAPCLESSLYCVVV